MKGKVIVSYSILVLLVVLGGLTVKTSQIQAATVVFKNEKEWKDVILDPTEEYSAYDTNKDGKLSAVEAKKVLGLTIKSAKGVNKLKYFPNIQYLYCGELGLKSLDVSKNTKLTVLVCEQNKLTELDVSKNKKLSELRCNSNKLKKLDVSKNKKLTGLYCNSNKLSKLDISKNKNLASLTCDSNELTEICVGNNNKKLYEIYCFENKIKYLDLSKTKNLTVLICDKSTEVKGAPENCYTQYKE